MSGTLGRVSALRDEEEEILQQHGLAAEQTISWIRLVVHLVRVISVPLATLTAQSFAEVSDLSTLRVVTLISYTVFVPVNHVVLLTRSRRHAGRNKWMPYVFITIDFLFLLGMGLSPTAYDVPFQTEMAAISGAVTLSYSALRLRRGHVIYSVVWAVGQYLVIVAHSVTHQRPVPLLVVVFVLTGYGAFGWLVLTMSRRVREMFTELRVRDGLRRFLPRQVADRVMANRFTSLQPVKREVTVLFSDLRDFTSVSESMDPAELLKMLDEYFGQMSQIVQGRGGIVNKFIGDGMLCFWGVPEADEKHALHAVEAALDMRVKVAELNQYREREGKAPLRIGVGIHTGVVAAGELGGGGDGLHEYTVIGDAVNLASRIEGLTKAHQVDVLVSADTWAQLGGVIAGRRLGEEKVKGRVEPVVVFAVDGRG